MSAAPADDLPAQRLERLKHFRHRGRWISTAWRKSCGFILLGWINGPADIFRLKHTRETDRAVRGGSRCRG